MRIEAQKKRGHLIVDAAICLPFFLLAMAALLGLFARVRAEDDAYRRIREYSEMISCALAAAEAVAGDGSELPVFSEEVRLDGGYYVDHVFTALALADGTPVTAKYRPFAGESRKAGDETPVYVFPKYGARYHVANCVVVLRDKKQEKSYILMAKDQAREEGYTPCGLCGGGDGEAPYPDLFR